MKKPHCITQNNAKPKTFYVFFHFLNYFAKVRETTLFYFSIFEAMIEEVSSISDTASTGTFTPLRENYQFPWKFDKGLEKCRFLPSFQWRFKKIWPHPKCSSKYLGDLSFRPRDILITLRLIFSNKGLKLEFKNRSPRYSRSYAKEFRDFFNHNRTLLCQTLSLLDMLRQNNCDFCLELCSNI